MQKILRRVKTAERVAAKRKANKDRLDAIGRRQQETNTLQKQLRWVNREINSAKTRIVQNFYMGPKASRRAVGNNAGKLNGIDNVRFGPYVALAPSKLDARCRWAGGFKNLNVVPGDRVVLLAGPERGRIGKIRRIDEDNAEAIIEDLNRSNIRTPAQAMVASNTSPLINLELPIPISAIRLVHPVFDPATGLTKDVIINELRHKDMITDKRTGRKEWSRVVPGLNLTIPWPKKPEPDEPINVGDTVRLDVETKTFTPTLLAPPMPPGVINELRNYYSRFRTRHEDWYIEKKAAEEQAKKDRGKLMDSMRTPLNELHREERANKKKKGKPRLTLEMLEKIGEVMAKNRERLLNAPPVNTSSDGGAPASAPKADVPPPADSSTPTSPPPPSA
ncbi:hypothetical protein F4780DRAFT_534239 [Xylariomycetidae sp. FL0641]|nr:hypothetical protein F4780DRAFT_534239 [Xylariomycetidae sp. FL0641]